MSIPVLLARWAARSAELSLRAAQGGSGVLDRTLTWALSPEEQVRLCVDLYAKGRAYEDRAPFHWEPAFFAEHLPEAPARVLILAAGGGAEAEQLLRLGHRVAATDPAGPLLAHVQTRCGSLVESNPERLVTAVLGFDEWIASCAGDAAMLPPALQTWLQTPVDAIVIGWGALSHYPGADNRVRLLQALMQACPSGPWLFSAICARRPGVGSPIARRAEALGNRLGRRIRTVRGLPGAPEPGDHVYPHVGFAHVFEREELEAMAARVQRRILWHQWDTSYPHGSMVAGEPG